MGIFTLSFALQNCTTVIAEDQHVVTKVYFRRLVLPLAAVSSGLVDFTVGIGVMVALATDSKRDAGREPRNRQEKCQT